jgi:hypothetical protein
VGATPTSSTPAVGAPAEFPSSTLMVEPSTGFALAVSAGTPAVPGQPLP